MAKNPHQVPGLSGDMENCPAWRHDVVLNLRTVERAVKPYRQALNSKLRNELLRHYGARAPFWRLVGPGKFRFQYGMADPLLIQTLKQKRAEISGVIAAYQAQIAQARHDLAHINLITQPRTRL